MGLRKNKSKPPLRPAQPAQPAPPRHGAILAEEFQAAVAALDQESGERTEIVSDHITKLESELSGLGQLNRRINAALSTG